MIEMIENITFEITTRWANLDADSRLIILAFFAGWVWMNCVTLLHAIQHPEDYDGLI